MVVSLSTKNPSTPTRPPLIPSEKSNNAPTLHNKPISKHITSPSPSLPKRAVSANRARSLHPSFSTTTTTTTRSLSVAFQVQPFSFQTTSPKTTRTRTRTRKSLSRSLDLAAVRLLRHSVVALVNGGDRVRISPFCPDDSDSSSSSGSHDQPRVPRGITVPARFRAESRNPKKASRPPASPPKRIETPSSARSGAGRPGTVASVASFAAAARRGKKGAGRVEEAHALRMMHNRYLQWRYVNARARGTLSDQRRGAEEDLYNAVTTLSEMRNSVALKGMEMQLCKQDLKLASILKGQMMYLEEWSLMDIKHHNAMSGTIEAMKASTLRLPIVGGARANIHELQSAVGSAVEVMQAMGTSMSALLSKVENASVLVSELARMAAHEQALLDQSKDILSTVAVMHVKQCSLQGQILQLNHSANTVQS